MKIGALIPARIGSKRLPKKNIKMLGGKPLICWTIDTLLEADMFADITVSTESKEVADVVRAHYSEDDINILIRPEELAGDDSPLSTVKIHYLENRPEIQWYGLFMPTMPFRKVETFKHIHTAILSGHPWIIKTCTTQTYPIMDYYYPVNGGVKRFFNDPCFYARMTHCIYMLERRDSNPGMWQHYGLSPAERVFIVHADATECIDIDTQYDFIKAEKICSGKKIFQRQLTTYRNGDWQFVAPKGTDFHAFNTYVKDKLLDVKYPILILEKPQSPLSFLLLSDGAQRRPWISPEVAQYLNSSKVEETGNMAYMPEHFCHSPYYRVKRDFGVYNNQRPLQTDVYGGRHGLDGSMIPISRVIFREDMMKESFWIEPNIWS